MIEVLPVICPETAKPRLGPGFPWTVHAPGGARRCQCKFDSGNCVVPCRTEHNAEVIRKPFGAYSRSLSTRRATVNGPSAMETDVTHQTSEPAVTHLHFDPVFRRQEDSKLRRRGLRNFLPSRDSQVGPEPNWLHALHDGVPRISQIRPAGVDQNTE